MAIFKRHEQSDVEQKDAARASGTGAPGGQPEQHSRVMPPFVAPRGAAAAGVVPPPAAPVYSMRPAESAVRVDDSAESSVATLVAEKLRATSEEQDSLQGSLRVAMQRTKTEVAPAQGVRRRPARPAAPLPPRLAHAQAPQGFDPSRAIQAGLLHLAWRWQQAGSPIRAIHAYMELLMRYPDTEAAAAAVADLVDLSEKLAREGQFHTALAIYEHLEHLA